MKKRTVLIIAFFMLITMASITACGGSTLSIDCSDAKAVHVDANKAAADDWVVTGSLEVKEGETVTLSANLEAGEIRIELFGGSGEQSIDEMPEGTTGEPDIMFMASGTNSMSGGLSEGSYLIKATVTEKATGTIDITAAAEG